MKEILIKPLITEKSLQLAEHGKYEFEVGKTANKNEVSQFIAKIYKVNPVSVNILTRKPRTVRHGKTVGKIAGKKIAIVTLKKDEKINLLEESKK